MPLLAALGEQQLDRRVDHGRRPAQVRLMAAEAIRLLSHDVGVTRNADDFARLDSRVSVISA